MSLSVFHNIFPVSTHLHVVCRLLLSYVTVSRPCHLSGFSPNWVSWAQLFERRLALTRG